MQKFMEILVNIFKNLNSIRPELTLSNSSKTSVVYICIYTHTHARAFKGENKIYLYYTIFINRQARWPNDCFDSSGHWFDFTGSQRDFFSRVAKSA